MTIIIPQSAIVSQKLSDEESRGVIAELMGKSVFLTSHVYLL